MAGFIPFFAISPNTIMSLIGYFRGPDKTVPTPPENWREARVNVIIPALNEEHNIPLCLASLALQTLKPHRIILIDDGSRDKTIENAETFCRVNNMEIEIIHRTESLGKTPTIKAGAREFDSDVEFILDGDTVLESENYIERTVEELYKAKGIASACGTILPFYDKDRVKMLENPFMRKFLKLEPSCPVCPSRKLLKRMNYTIINLYRDALYLFLQHFIYQGQIAFFGTMISPVGCAVAYRNKYIKDMFDKYEPILGDDLTTSEDIFIGFSNLNEGYRNVQLTDVYARSTEPKATHLLKQVFLWSSSFFQSCYYFNSLLKSPFKSLKRYRYHRSQRKKLGKQVQEKREIQEPYRQAFGSEYTKKFGRPIGWPILTSLFEKISFPIILLVVAILGWWEALAITLAAETVVSLTLLVIVAKGHRIKYLLKGIFLTPIRYAVLLSDLYTLGHFAVDVWILRNRAWRK